MIDKFEPDKGERVDDGLASILAAIDKDIAANKKVVPLSPEMVQHAIELVGNIDLDLDEPIVGDVDL